MKRRQSMIRGTALSGDATFKVPSKYVVNVPFGSSMKRLKAIFTVRNENSDIMDQAPISGAGATADGMSGDLGSVSEMWKSVSIRIADDPPEIYSTDNCCSEAAILLSHMPYLKETPMAAAASMPSDALFDGSVIRLSTFEETQACFARLLEWKPAQVGFDMEWYWLPLERRQRKTALVQVAYRDQEDNPTVLLVHLAAFQSQCRNLPPAFNAFLYSSAIQKLGVGIANDVKKLARDFQVDSARCLPSCLDLGESANLRAPWTQVRKWSLSALSLFTLGKQLPKPEAIRLSNWEVAPLTSEQETYAADDAWVALEIFSNLMSSTRRPSALSFSLPTVPEGSTPEFDVEDDEPMPPTAPASVPRDSSSREKPCERVREAQAIANEGLELDSNWLLLPPVEDKEFVARLNSEKSRRMMISRIKLDPFHWMDRYARVLPTSHVLFPVFMACLRDALFHLDQGDVAAHRLEMVRRGMDPDAAERIPKQYFTKRNRCRRSIPPRLELAVRVQAVFEVFVGLTDGDGVLFLKEKAMVKHTQCMEHVWSGCLSDIPGMPMYYERRSANGFVRYITIRGTSQLECYHRWLRACISGSQLAPELFADLLLHFNYRWNVRCGIRNRGHSDQSTYSHWILEDVLRRSGSRCAGGLFPGLIVATSQEDAKARGIDVDSNGFHVPKSHGVAPVKNMGATDSDGEDLSSDEDEEDDDEDDEDGGSDEENAYIKDDPSLLPIDLTELEKGIAGDCLQAPMLAMAPVSCFAEIIMIMRLAESQLSALSSRKRKKRNQHWGLDYASLAFAFNEEAGAAFNLDASSLLHSGIRLKSPAQIKIFFEKFDDALVVSHTTSGVRDRLIALRRQLRDSTSFPTPPIMAPEPPPPTFCCGAEATSSSQGNASMIDDDDAPVGDDHVPPLKSKPRKKAARSCPDCRREKRDIAGHSYRQVGTRSETRFVCSHPACPKFALLKPEEPATTTKEELQVTKETEKLQKLPVLAGAGWPRVFCLHKPNVLFCCSSNMSRAPRASCGRGYGVQASALQLAGRWRWFANRSCWWVVGGFLIRPPPRAAFLFLLG